MGVTLDEGVRNCLMALYFMDGNEAAAWGAVNAGCRFFAGYPITPATTIYNTMLNLLPPLGGVCLQGEDEIASMGFCLGASMAGLKTMTATSGPGVSLYSEQISFAIGSEIPVVIVDVQRLGPSTGSATRGADGDIQFLRWGSSGGLPVIVLAPSNVEECFSLTRQAFNLAETFRCPVFIASNKDIAMTRESVHLDLAGEFEQKNRVRSPRDKQFLPFQTRGGALVPDFLPIGGTTLVRQTSSTHGPDGYITTDPVIIQETRDRLQAKLTSSIDQFTFFEAFTEDLSDTLVITYGITTRAAKEVFEEQKEKGKPVSLLALKTLWPIPEELIKKKAERFKKIMVVEMNMGQYVREIERILPNKSISFMGQMDGNLITPSAIKRGLIDG